MICCRCGEEFVSTQTLKRSSDIIEVGFEGMWGTTTFDDINMCHACSKIEQKQYFKRLKLIISDEM